MSPVVNLDALLSSRHGSIHGPIWIVLSNGHSFPADGWYDFVIVLLGWWIDAARQMLQGQHHVELGFMEGSYTVKMEQTGEAIVVRATRRSKVIHETIVSPSEVAEFLVKCEAYARLAVRFARSNGWVGRDVDQLAGLLE